MVTQAKDQWSLLEPSIACSLPLSAYGTPDQPSLLVNVPALETYSPSRPFKAPLLDPLSDLDCFVFAHQIACGMEYLSSRNVRCVNLYYCGNNTICLSVSSVVRLA